MAAARWNGMTNPESMLSQKHLYLRTFTRKYHHESDVLIKNTVQMSNFIKSERQVEARQREWKEG